MMMRPRLAALLILVTAGAATATGVAASGGAEPGRDAVFAWASYADADPAAPAFPLRPGTFRNPVLPGFQPDPSIVRVGADYYLVNSSFAFFPGLPIFHSPDLVNWTQIGNAIDRPGLFDFSGLGIARAIFAPTIRHYRGVFYIVGTCIECGSNFLMTATDPAGPWSAPIWMHDFDGIDPDLFVDDDGSAWIANNGPPAGPPLYDGHRAIWIQQFDLKSHLMKGPRRVLVDGGVHIADKPVWAEGPHIIKHSGWYYLIAAEGGTAGNHSQTVYRSKAVTGPYVAAPFNPILTQRDLDPARPYPIAATGHADFVETPGKHWWAVFLATRPYEADLSSMGRETFLLPVTWPAGGWPQILAPHTPVPRIVARPRLAPAMPVDRSKWRDNFDTAVLARDWLMLRTPKSAWFSLAAMPGAMTLTARAVPLGSTGNPSFLGKRQRQANAVFETELRYTPVREGDRAGLAVFADERHHYFVGLWRTASGPMLVVAMRNGAADPEQGRIIAAVPLPAAPGSAVRLRITAAGAAYSFAYALEDGRWQTLLSGADGRILASERTNLFTGAIIGLHAARSVE